MAYKTQPITAPEMTATDRLKKLETAIQKMSLALLESSMFSPEAVELLKSGRISNKRIVEGVKIAKAEMNPAPLPVEIRYAVGFAFTHTFSHVLLMWKAKPTWQKGKLNGPGGKVEAGETPAQGMVREFKEETNIDTDFDFADMEGKPTWLYVGTKGRPALTQAYETGSYELSIYGITLDFDVMKESEGFNKVEPLILLPLNVEILRRKGVADLAMHVAATLGSMREGFHMRVEDPPIYGEL